ncbi:MAG: hypothetical protein ABIS29_08580 [Vicinamibacterales bacterium]
MSPMLRLSTAFLVGVGVVVTLACSAGLPQSDASARVQDKIKQVEETLPMWVKSGGNPRRLEPSRRSRRVT